MKTVDFHRYSVFVGVLSFPFTEANPSVSSSGTFQKFPSLKAWKRWLEVTDCYVSEWELISRYRRKLPIVEYYHRYIGHFQILPLCQKVWSLYHSKRGAADAVPKRHSLRCHDFMVARVTTAHAHQCCILSELCEDCAVANEIDYDIDNAGILHPWQRTRDHGVWRLTLTAYYIHELMSSWSYNPRVLHPRLQGPGWHRNSSVREVRQKERHLGWLLSHCFLAQVGWWGGGGSYKNGHRVRSHF